jgi:hypothetical protein
MFIYLFIYLFACTVATLGELTVLLSTVLKVVHVHDFGYHDDTGIRRHHWSSVVLIQHSVHHSVPYYSYNYVPEMYGYNFGHHRQTPLALDYTELSIESLKLNQKRITDFVAHFVLLPVQQQRENCVKYTE